MLDWIQHLGAHFSAAQYLFWSRIEGTLWTLADVVIVFYLIRIVNLCRTFLSIPPRRLPYWFLAATLPAAAFIPVVQTGRAFFLLEVAVTVPHFLLILWLVFSDAPAVLGAVRRRASGIADFSSQSDPG